MSDPIDMTWVTDVCQIGAGEKCCAYLIGGAEGLECAKDYDKGPEMIEQNLPRMVAKGDNCAGWGQTQRQKANSQLN